MQTNAINIDGDVTDSRIVGNVLYLVSAHYSWYDRFGSPDDTNKTVILSVDIANPAQVHAVESQDFPQDGWEQHLSVTPNTVYISSSGWDSDERLRDGHPLRRHLGADRPHRGPRQHPGAWPRAGPLVDG